jgi:hypothetical protein
MRNGRRRVADNHQPLFIVIKGRVVRAIYRTPECLDHADNPLQEALPPILTDDQAAIRLAYYPDYKDAQRRAPAHIRSLLIQNGMKFFAPLDIHLDLQRRFSNLLRIGYAGRNPLEPGFWRKMKAKLESFDQYGEQYESQPDRLPSAAAGFNILGPSGVGKSFSVERVLSLTPQVIYHSEYRGRSLTHAQLVWLKLDCPFDGNLRGLCIHFFKAVDSILGTTYKQQYVKERRLQDELLSDMRTVAATHFLGVLVIDEIQRLSLAKSGGAEKMLNFFVQLITELGVPVVLVGNYKAMSVLSGDFSQMRRGTGQGDLIWDLMEKDEQWQLFVESLWRFQYTKKKFGFADEVPHSKGERRSPNQIITLSDVLYEETQGITDFAVKAYMFAQERAIDSGKEVVTADIIRSAVRDKIRIPREVLYALRTKDKRVLENYEDLYYVAFKSYLHQQPESVQLTGKINSAPEIQVLLQTEDGNSHQQQPDDSLASSTSTNGNGAINSPSKTSRKSAASRRSKSNVKSDSIKGELPKLVSSLGKEDGTLAYEALRQAGYIRPSNEYLEME